MTEQHKPLHTAGDTDKAVYQAIADNYAAQAGAEPVAWIDKAQLRWLTESPESLTGATLAARQRSPSMIPLYTHPPARVTLTRQEIDQLWCEYPSDEFGFANAVIAAYEAKNGIGGGK